MLRTGKLGSKVTQVAGIRRRDDSLGGRKPPRVTRVYTCVRDTSGK